MQVATTIDGDNGMIVKRLSVPIGLEELMESLTKQVLLKKPKDIYSFASDHFAHLLTIRDKTVTDPSNQKESNGLHSAGKSSIKVKSATVATKFNKLPTPIIFTNCKTIRQNTPNNPKSTTRKSVNISPRSLDRGRNVVSSSSDTSQKNDMTRQARAGRARWKKRDVNDKDKKPPISLPPSHRIRDSKKSRSASTDNTKPLDSGRKLRKTTSEPDDGSVKERKRLPTNRRMVSSDRSSKPDSKSSISKNSSGDDDSISVKGSSISLSNKAASKKSRSPPKKAAIVAPIPIAAAAAAATLIKDDAQNKVNLINEKNLGKTEHITETNKIQIKDDAGDSDFVDEDDRDGTAIENMEYVGGEVESKDVPVERGSPLASTEAPNDKSENISDNLDKTDVINAQVSPTEADVKSSDIWPKQEQKDDISDSTITKSATDDKHETPEEDKEGDKDELSQSNGNENPSEDKIENLEDLGTIAEIAEVAENNKASDSISGQQESGANHEEIERKIADDDAIAKEVDQKEDAPNKSKTEAAESVINSEGTESANIAADHESKEEKMNEIDTNVTKLEDASEKNKNSTNKAIGETDDLNKSTEKSNISSEDSKEDKDDSLPKPNDIIEQKDVIDTATESKTGPDLVELKNDTNEQNEDIESTKETGLVSDSSVKENEETEASVKPDSETHDKVLSFGSEPNDKTEETTNIVNDADAAVKATDEDSSKSKDMSEDIDNANEGAIISGSDLGGAKNLDSDNISVKKNEFDVMLKADNKSAEKEDSDKETDALKKNAKNADSKDLSNVGIEDNDGSKASHDDISTCNDKDVKSLISEKLESNDNIQKDNTVNDAKVKVNTDSEDSNGVNGNDTAESVSMKNGYNLENKEPNISGFDDAKNIADINELNNSEIKDDSNAPIADKQEDEQKNVAKVEDKPEIEEASIADKPEDKQENVVEEKPETEETANVTDEKQADDISKTDSSKMVDSNHIEEPSKQIVDENQSESKVIESLPITNLNNENSSEGKEQTKTDGDSLTDQSDIHNLTKSFLETEQQNYVDEKLPTLDKSIAVAPHDVDTVAESKNEISAEMPKASMSSEDIVKTADIKSEHLDDNLAEVDDGKKAEIVDEGPLMLEDVSKYLRGSQDDGNSNLSKTLDVPINEAELGSRAEDTISTAEDDTIDQVDSLPISEDSMVFGQTVKPEEPQVEALKSDTQTSPQAQLPGDDAIKAATTIQAYLRGHLVRKELMSNPNTAHDDKLYTLMEESEEATGDGGRVKRDVSSFTSEHADRKSVDGESSKNEEVLGDISSGTPQIAKDQGKVASPDNKSEDGDEELSRPVTAIEVSSSDANSGDETNHDKPKANDDSNDKTDKAISVAATEEQDESAAAEEKGAASEIDQIEPRNNLSPNKLESTGVVADTYKRSKENSDILESEKVEEAQVSDEKSTFNVVANVVEIKDVSHLDVNKTDENSKSDIASDITFTINEDKEKLEVPSPKPQDGIENVVKSEPAEQHSPNVDADAPSLDVDKNNEDPKSDVASDKTFTLNDDRKKPITDSANKTPDKVKSAGLLSTDLNTNNEDPKSDNASDKTFTINNKNDNSVSASDKDKLSKMNEEKSAGLLSTDLNTNNEDPKSDNASDKTFTINDGNDKPVSPTDMAKRSEMNEVKVVGQLSSALEEQNEDPKSDNASDKTFTINDVKDKLTSSSVDPVNEIKAEVAKVAGLNLDKDQEDPKSDVASDKTFTIDDEKNTLALSSTDLNGANYEDAKVVGSDLGVNNEQPKNESAPRKDDDELVISNADTQNILADSTKSEAAKMLSLDVGKEEDPKSDIASDKTFTIDDGKDKLRSSSVESGDEVANKLKSKDAEVPNSDEISKDEDATDKTFSIEDGKSKVVTSSAEPQNMIEAEVQSDLPDVAGLNQETNSEDSKSDMSAHNIIQNNADKDNLNNAKLQGEDESNALGNLELDTPKDDKDKEDTIQVEPQGDSKGDVSPSLTSPKNEEGKKSDEVADMVPSTDDEINNISLVDAENSSIAKDENKSEETGSVNGHGSSKSEKLLPNDNGKDNLNSQIAEMQQEVQDESKSTLGDLGNNDVLNAAQTDSDNTGSNLPDADSIESKVIPSSSSFPDSAEGVQNASSTNLAEELSSKEHGNAGPLTSLDNSVSTALNNKTVAPNKPETISLITKEQHGSDYVESGDSKKGPESDSDNKAIGPSDEDINSSEIKLSSNLEDENAVKTPTSNHVDGKVIEDIGAVSSEKDTITEPDPSVQESQTQDAANTGGKPTKDLELPTKLSHEQNNFSIANLNSEETVNNKEATAKSEDLVESVEKAQPNESDLHDNHEPSNLNAEETANNTNTKNENVDETADNALPNEHDLHSNNEAANLNADKITNNTGAKRDDVDETGGKAQPNKPDLLTNDVSITDLTEPLKEENKEDTLSEESANTAVSSAKNENVVVSAEEVQSDATDVVDSKEDSKGVVTASSNTDNTKVSSEVASSKGESSKDGAEIAPLQTSEVSEIRGEYAENEDLSNKDANKTASGSNSTADQGVASEPTDKDLKGVTIADDHGGEKNTNDSEDANLPKNDKSESVTTADDYGGKENTNVSENVNLPENKKSASKKESLDGISVVAVSENSSNLENPQGQIDVLNSLSNETDDKTNENSLKDNTVFITDLPSVSKTETDGKEQNQIDTSNEANKSELFSEENNSAEVLNVEAEISTAKESEDGKNSKDSEVLSNDFSVVDTNILTPKDSESHIEQTLDSLQNKDGKDAHSTYVQDVNITPGDIQSSIEASHKEIPTQNGHEEIDLSTAKENIEHLPLDSASSDQAVIKDGNIDLHELKDAPIGTASVAVPPSKEKDSDLSTTKADESTSAITPKPQSSFNESDKETREKFEENTNKPNSENNLPETKENETDNPAGSSTVNGDAKEGDKIGDPSLDNSSDLKNEAETNHDSLTSEHDTKDILDQIKNDLNHMKNLIEEKDDLDGITTPEFEYPHKADENVGHFNQLGRLISTGSTTSLDSAATVVVTEDLNKLKPTGDKSQIHAETTELNGGDIKDDLQSENLKRDISSLGKEGSKAGFLSENHSEASLEDVKNAINSQSDAQTPVIGDNSDISKATPSDEQINSLKQETENNDSNEAILDATAASDSGTVEQEKEKTPGDVVDINNKTNIDDDKTNKNESALSSDAVQPSLGDFIRSLSRSPPSSRNDDKSKIQQLFPSRPESANAEATSPILAQENEKPEPFYLHEPGKSKAGESLSSSPVMSHGTSMGLMHSGEFHDSVPLNFSNDVHVIIQDQRSATVTPTFTGLQHSGEFHDGLIPHGSVPAGAETVTVAHASDRDGSTLPGAVADAADAVESMPAMDGKRNNATIVEKNSESEAATKIQASFRGYQVRKQLKTKNGGDITSPRRSARRKSSGKIMDSNKAPPKKEKGDLEERSATKIQAGIRGFLVRRRHQKTKPSDSP